MTDTTELEALDAAVRITSSLRQKLSDLNIPISRHPLPTDVDALIPELVLSVPHDVVAPMATLECPSQIRETLLERLNRFIDELRQQYKSTYRHSCLETLCGTNSIDDLYSIHRAYQALYQRQFIPTIRNQVAYIVAEVAKYQTHASESKRPFNNDFTPILEKYFEYNGYPSVFHRSILAQKSKMTPRQIEVWFQNHRKRSKQDGKIVQRLDSDLPLKRALSISLERTQRYQPRMLTPSDDEKISHNFDKTIDILPSKRRKLTSCLEETPETHKDDLFRPPHAFPEPRKSQHDDPYPNDNGVFRFPPPIWRRKPAATPIIPTEIDMDDFARTFHMKLNFVNGPWKRESTPSKSDLPSFTPWFAPSRTIPSRAPHPSLVRTYDSLVESSIMSSLTTDPYTFDFGQKSNELGISCVVRLPYGPTLSDSSIIERLEYLDETPRRQVASLPRRAPSSSTPSASLLPPPGEVPRRKVSPLPRRAPSKTQSFGSRTSSFSSESSLSSDDTISSPSTPPSLPNQTLVSVESDDSTYNFDNYTFDFSSLTSNPSPRTFDFSEEKFPYDEQSSTLFQDFTPLVIC